MSFDKGNNACKSKVAGNPSDNVVWGQYKRDFKKAQ